MTIGGIPITKGINVVINVIKRNMDNMEGQFSREFREQMRENRYNDFEALIKWLIENKIPFKKECTEIEIGNIIIYDNMKVKFGTSKKYQYNLPKLKERILKDNE